MVALMPKSQQQMQANPEPSLFISTPPWGRTAGQQGKLQTFLSSTMAASDWQAARYDQFNSKIAITLLMTIKTVSVRKKAP
jgi:hypothetical protein